MKVLECTISEELKMVLESRGIRDTEDLLDPLYADDLADKMEKFILLSNSEREQMGKNGRKIVEEAFDRDIVIRAYIEEIEKVCQ